MGCSISKRQKSQQVDAPETTSSPEQSQEKSPTPQIVKPPLSREPDEAKWCQQMLAEWREAREKSVSSQEAFDWPEAQVCQVVRPQEGAGDKKSRRRKRRVITKPTICQTVDRPNDDQKKEQFVQRIQKERNQRKKLAQQLPSDDTICELPTRMPTISFSGYQDGRF